MRAAFGEPAGFLIVSGADQEKSAEQLLALGIGAVGHHDSAASRTHRSSGVEGQLFSALEATFQAEPVAPVKIFFGNGRGLLRGKRRRRAGGAVQQQDEIGHGGLLSKGVWAKSPPPIETTMEVRLNRHRPRRKVTDVEGCPAIRGS